MWISESREQRSLNYKHTLLGTDVTAQTLITLFALDGVSSPSFSSLMTRSLRAKVVSPLGSQVFPLILAFVAAGEWCNSIH